MIQNKITTKIATKVQMATRLATQRTNFVTVTPVSAATATTSVVETVTQQNTNGISAVSHQHHQQQQQQQTTTTTLIPTSVASASAAITASGISDTIISSPSSAGATVATKTVDGATGALTLQQVIRQVCTKVGKSFFLYFFITFDLTQKTVL